MIPLLHIPSLPRCCGEFLAVRWTGHCLTRSELCDGGGERAEMGQEQGDVKGSDLSEQGLSSQVRHIQSNGVFFLVIVFYKTS